MPKSYKDCPHWRKNGSMTSRRKVRRLGLSPCSNAQTNRMCRRCPYISEMKLKVWAEEMKQRKIQRISERQNLPALLTTPFNTIKSGDNKEYPCSKCGKLTSSKDLLAKLSNLKIKPENFVCRTCYQEE